MFPGERMTRLRENARAAARKAATRATERATQFLQNPSTKRTATYAGGILVTAAAIGLAAKGLRKDSAVRTEVRKVRKDLKDKVAPAVRDSATRMKQVWHDTLAPALREEAATLKGVARTAVREVFDARRNGRHSSEPAQPTPPEPPIHQEPTTPPAHSRAEPASATV
jgi:hypothetical protein